MKKILFTLSVLAASILPSAVSANSIISIASSGSIQPESQVTVTVSSSVIDLGGADIAWSIDGQPISGGMGLTSTKVTVGALGEQTHVTALISFLGAIYRNDIILTPSIMDVLWEAQTATPPFFHGKALPSHMSAIKTLAIPFFGTSSNDTMPSYNWKKDRTISLGTGVGNSSVQVLGAWQNASIPISVDAQQGDQSISQSLKIPSFIPSAYFYEISPSQGTLTQSALPFRYEKDSPELVLLAVPYGVANSARNRSRVQYDWLSNDTNIQSGFGINLERIRLSRINNPNTTGSLTIAFSAQNAIDVMQLAEGKFNWFFTKK